MKRLFAVNVTLDCHHVQQIAVRRNVVIHHNYDLRKSSNKLVDIATTKMAFYVGVFRGMDWVCGWR